MSESDPGDFFRTIFDLGQKYIFQTEYVVVALFIRVPPEASKFSIKKPYEKICQS